MLVCVCVCVRVCVRVCVIDHYGCQKLMVTKKDVKNDKNENEAVGVLLIDLLI